MTQPSSVSVFHDLERNLYYRIDKYTGDVSPSHKNGQPIPSFRPEFSGSDYKLRQTLDPQPERPRRKFALNRPKNPNPHQLQSSKIVSLYRMDENNGNSQRASLSRNDGSRLSNSRLKSQESEVVFLTQDGPLKKQSSPVSGILKHFEKLSEEKIFDNHCQRGKETGTVPSTTLTLNAKGFRETQNIVYQPSNQLGKRAGGKIVRAGSQAEEVRASGEWKKQVSMQKKLFLQFHPHLQGRESTRLLNEQLQRKKNIKHLEQLFLEESAKATNRIYS